MSDRAKTAPLAELRDIRVSFGGARHSTWKGLSWLNERHMLWAWLSLFSVGLTDFYIRLVSMGRIQDLRIL